MYAQFFNFKNQLMKVYRILLGLFKNPDHQQKVLSDVINDTHAFDIKFPDKNTNNLINGLVRLSPAVDKHIEPIACCFEKMNNFE